jgi:hypothetical protein
MQKFPGLKVKEFQVFRKLNTPSKIQDFLNEIPINFEPTGDTCRSPLMVLRDRRAHCIEGALLAAAALWYHGEKPILMDLRTTKHDHDHVVALFRKKGRWGAVSKTNHVVLRYRDPVFRTVRELAMSYFSEYYTDDGKKSLRSHSGPFSLLGYDPAWLTADFDLWDIVEALDDSPHFDVLPKGGVNLRPADALELKAGDLVDWKKAR